MTFAHYLSDLDLGSHGLVVHIGAGAGAQVPHYTQIGFSNIFVIEANVDLYADLAAVAAQHTQVKVIKAAFSEAGKNTPFYQLNFAEFSTLKDPSGLSALLPGIKVAERHNVKTISAAELSTLLPKLDPNKADLLVVEAFGSEANILDALWAAQSLERFEYLVVRCPQECYFEDAFTGVQLVQSLKTRGFSWLDRNDHEDPDWPVYFFQRDPLVTENRNLLKEIENLQTSLQQIVVANQSTQVTHDTALSELGTQRDAAQNKLDQLHASHEALQGKLKEITSQRDKVQEKSEETYKSVQTSEATLKSQRSDLAIALRMQTIARNDHMELQSRYTKIKTEKEQLERLLVDLTQKLGSAASHLRLMSAPVDVAVEYEVEDGLPHDAPVAKATSKRTRKPKKSK